MDFAGLPLVLFLLLPGFLAINIALLVGTFRRLSAFHGTAWSLLVSFLLVGMTYATYVWRVEPPSGTDSWPGLLEVLADPAQMPAFVWIGLYAESLVVGISFGIAERRGYVRSLLLKIGIDLVRRGDLWSGQFRESRAIRVYLKDGNLLSGWPEYYSADRSDPGPEVYLTSPRIWSEEDSAWREIEGTSGVLLHGDEISRIEFLTSVYGDEEVASA